MKKSNTYFLLPVLMFLGVSTSYAMPNPAAKYCVDQGGKLESVRTEDGSQMGLCVFGSAAVEQWTFFRLKKAGKPQAAVSNFCVSHGSLASDIAHPEAVYCKTLGGMSVKGIVLGSNATVGLCHFQADNSTIEERTLFTGPHFKDNVELNNVVGCN